MTKFPILIRIKDIVNPLITTKKSIIEMNNKVVQDDVPQILLEAFVVFSISRFESMMTQILNYFYKKVPEKLDIKEVKLLKEDIISDDPIESAIERVVNNLMYGRIDEIIVCFCNAIGISIKTEEAFLDRLIEYKESRNLLIHNNSRVNKIYLDKCRSYRRADKAGKIISFDKHYVSNSLLMLLEIIDIFQREIEEKYSKYTNIKAFIELWNYTFNTPIIKFDDYWIISEKEDRLQYKYPEIHPGISGSERMYLGLWIVHYNGDSNLLKNFNMHSISDKQKINFILNALGDLHLGG